MLKRSRRVLIFLFKTVSLGVQPDYSNIMVLEKGKICRSCTTSDGTNNAENHVYLIILGQHRVRKEKQRVHTT